MYFSTCYIDAMYDMFYRFCPSVFFYLLSVVPAIWFLELHQMENRILRRSTLKSNLTSAVAMLVDNNTEQKLRAEIEGLGVNFTITIQIF